MHILAWEPKQSATFCEPSQEPLLITTVIFFLIFQYKALRLVRATRSSCLADDESRLSSCVSRRAVHCEWCHHDTTQRCLSVFVEGPPVCAPQRPRRVPLHQWKPAWILKHAAQMCGWCHDAAYLLLKLFTLLACGWIQMGLIGDSRADVASRLIELDSETQLMGTGWGLSNGVSACLTRLCFVPLSACFSQQLEKR